MGSGLVAHPGTNARGLITLTNVINFSDPGKKRTEVRENAALWLARLDAGASAEDLRALEAWLSEDEMHARELLALATMWGQMDVLSELSDIFPLEGYRKARVSRWLGGRLAMASVAVLVAVFFVGIWHFTGSGAAGSVPDYAETFSTQVGEQMSINAPDGSSLLINTNTSLEIDYTDSARNVYLNSGEGLFNVSADIKRPFRVYAGESVVEAVGTAFTVQASDTGEVEVLVTEGKVRFLKQSGQLSGSVDPGVDRDDMSSETEVLSLTAGQFAAVTRGGAELRRREFNPEEMEVRLSWQHGMLLFRSEPLEQVLKEVSRYTAVRIDAEEELLETRVDGYFRVGDIEGLLMAMETNFQIMARELDGNHILLTKSE